MWKQAVTKDLIYKSLPPVSPFPSIHNIEIGEKSIQISFKHRADAHSFVNVIKVIIYLRTLQVAPPSAKKLLKSRNRLNFVFFWQFFFVRFKAQGTGASQ